MDGVPGIDGPPGMKGDRVSVILFFRFYEKAIILLQT